MYGDMWKLIFGRAGGGAGRPAATTASKPRRLPRPTRRPGRGPLRRRRRVQRPLSALEQQQRREARGVILERLAHWSGVMGITPGRVAVRNQRSRWGSASSLGNLNFHWRIAGLPPEICDYVIIHELAHLKQMNHSPAFWELVAAYCPGYKAHRKWLREHSRAGLTVA